MFGLLVIFGQFWGEPWYGKNASLMERLPTGLRDVELTGCRFLSVPGPVATQRHTRAAINLVDKPQRACRGQDQTPARTTASDSTQLVQLALTELRKVSRDTLPIGVSRFLRAGDSVIIDLAPVQPPGQMILGGGGRFVLRRGAIVAAQLYQSSLDRQCGGCLTSA